MEMNGHSIHVWSVNQEKTEEREKKNKEIVWIKAVKKKS